MVRYGVKCSVFITKTNEVNSLEVPEHVRSTEQHGCGVGDVPSYSLCKGVAGTLKKKRETEDQE